MLKAQQDPSSPSYHQWLTPQQYGAEFGLTEGDISKVTVWLQSQGFTVDKVAQNRNAIWFSGTAALAEAAFHTQIHKYLVDGTLHFANAAAVSVPSALADTVNRVGGLSDFKLKPQLVRPVKANKNGVSPQFTSGSTGNHFIQPGDFAVIYDMNPLYSASFTGSGVTIGVMGQTDIVMADITDFRNAASPTLPAYGSAGGPTFTNFLIPTSPDPGLSPSDIGEADLDLEWSGGVGTNANIVFVNSTDVIFGSLVYAIENQINSLTIPILTVSYAGCEAAFTPADISTLEAAFQEANVQGQTIINSSGDAGAAACDDQSATVTSAVQGLAVNYPTSSPEVTGLGGSEFMGDGTAENPQTGSGTYWSANGSNDLVTSAKSYIPEMAWNDTAFDIANGGGLSAGGGGVSILFAKPSWQAGVPGIPADGHRDVPDISIDASADHDGYLFCTEVVLESSSTGAATPSCTNGFRISDPGFSDDQGLNIIGGTSVSAPAFAGMLAAIEQKLGTALGNIDPDLYTLASTSTTYASAFHDITVGNNEVPCTTGTTDCPTTGSNPMIGYAAGTGYDQATGLGSVDGNKLATAFSTIAITPGTTTTVTFSPAPPVVVGAAVTLTATVVANSGTATPAGSVVFTVDGAAMAPVSLTAGVATAMTTFSTGGIHSVVAVYTPGTGDNFFASTGSTSITVVATGSITTTTTVALNPSTSVAIGSSLVINATVTSSPLTGTLPGTVNFFAGTNLTTPLNATPVAITPGATGTGTASYTVSNVQTSQGFVVGSTTITAHYTGTSAYAASTGTAPITVTNPTITMTVANMTISGSSPGNTGTSAIAVTSMGGYAGTVNLTATAATLNASYMITPTAVTIASGATGMASISIQTVAAAIKEGVGGNLKHSTPTSNNRAIAGAAAAFGCIFLLGIPGFRKKRWPMLTVLLLLGALSAGLGCGGGGPSGASPKGTYTVTVTGTDSVNNAITVSTNFTVTIQ